MCELRGGLSRCIDHRCQGQGQLLCGILTALLATACAEGTPRESSTTARAEPETAVHVARNGSRYHRSRQYLRGCVGAAGTAGRTLEVDTRSIPINTPEPRAMTGICI